MKKTSFAFILVLALFFANEFSLSAQSVDKKSENNQPAIRGQFIDNNNDGVCDNAGKLNPRCNFKDLNNDRVCDNSGNRKNSRKSGLRYADQNNNGICDNRGQNKQSHRNCGNGNRHRNGQNMCRPSNSEK